jgi:hypothetical protein
MYLGAFSQDSSRRFSWILPDHQNREIPYKLLLLEKAGRVSEVGVLQQFR